MNENENLRSEKENSTVNNVSDTIDSKAASNKVNEQTPRATNILSIASLILGVLSCVTCCIGIHPLLTGMPLGSGILAIVFSNGSRRDGVRDSNAKAGLICGIVGLVIASIIVIFWIIAITILIIEGSAPDIEHM
jgi:hypothetical protein